MKQVSDKTKRNTSGASKRGLSRNGVVFVDSYVHVVVVFARLFAFDMLWLDIVSLRCVSSCLLLIVVFVWLDMFGVGVCHRG